MINTELEEQLRQDQIKYLLAQFVDIHGVAKAKAVPIAHAEEIFGDGAGFAAFAVDGLGLPPHGPDFMAVGDPGSYRKMPWMPGFARVSCEGQVRGSVHPLDSRFIAGRAIAALREATGHGFYTGLEPEFTLLRKDPETGKVAPAVESDQLAKPCYDYRAFHRASGFLIELTDALIEAGLDVYQIDHEDGNGQYEINYTFADAITTADDFVFIKMAASEIAAQQGLICSFMPKPFSQRPGSGMHMHLSMGRVGENAFFDQTDKNGLGLSELAYHFLGGLIQHAPGLTAIACPSVNSYKRLFAGTSDTGATWAPTSIAYGDNNRTAFVRVPYGRLELRVPDAGSNPYLLTAAVIAAGLDGVETKADPGPARNINFYELSAAEKKEAGIASLPSSLRDALDAFEDDEVIQAMLGEELSREFVSLKRREWDDYHRHVSDWETAHYLDFF